MHGVFDVALSVPGAMDSTATYMLAMRTGRESGGGKSRNPFLGDIVRWMRATLDIDDEVLFAVQDLAAVEEKSAGKTLSDLARQALQRQPTESSEVRNGFPLLRRSRNFVTPSQDDQLLGNELGK